MPEYLAPGVFVEEVSYRAKSIEGVGTSVAGIVGPTRTGPLRGLPEVCTSFGEFVRTYGGLEDLTFSGPGGGTVKNHTAHAARAFFDNGGKQLYVARAVAGGIASAKDGSGSSAALASRSAVSGGTTVTFRARFPGGAGNYVLELLWRDSEDLLRVEAATPVQAQVVLLTGVVTRQAFNPPLAAPADDAVQLRLSALATRTGDNYIVNGSAVVCTRVDDGTAVAVPADAVLPAAGLPAGVRFLTAHAKAPAGGALSAQTPAELTFRSAPIGLNALLGDLGGLTKLIGTLTAQNGRGVSLTFPATLNPGLGGDRTVNLIALAAVREQVAAVLVQREFDLLVRGRSGTGQSIASDDRDGEEVWIYPGCSLDPAAANALAKRMPAAPSRRADAMASPVSCTVTGAAPSAAELLAALRTLFDATALVEDPVRGSRSLIALTGGTDGTPPLAVDYAGEVDTGKGSVGFAAFEDIEDVSIVMAPAAVVLEQAAHQAVVLEMQKHCAKMRYRVAVVDSRLGQTVGEVRQWRGQFSDDRLALYYPWVRVADPAGAGELVLPPAGFIAGLYARTDVQRGVHKAPANDVVFGALGFEIEVNKFQQELLNPIGINCLRSFPGRGHRVWGTRTLSGDPEWKYVNVRRFFLYLERSIDKSTQWAVFEPNGEQLWSNIRTAVDEFLFNEWSNGRLAGGSPKEAYFVRCDRSTMTQNDLDNGRLVCQVGVAPLYPAEFVIFRIGQKTADAK